MHIRKVELENIKSYAHATFNFTRGTTAITGENGAGKTTIIEAIAWVLFDLLEYKKEDFVRRGEKKGWARVTFESGLDEREYVVFRDSGTAYNVTDPRLNRRVADKKEEVFRFLWQHLGLEPGTDLKSLFRQAIGVPQGTFTAIFLATKEVRKNAFDLLLRVEEYRQAAEKLRETSRFLDVQVTGVREAIARAEGELMRFDTVAEEHKSVSEQTKVLAEGLETSAAIIEKKRSLVRLLDDAERIENAVENVKRDRVRIAESLENVQKAHAEIEGLKPKVAEQERLETDKNKLRERIAEARAIDGQIKNLDETIERLRSSYTANRTQLRDAEEKAKAAGDVKTLEIRDAELIRQVAAFRAELDRDQKFQSEVKNGLCPILSEKCLNLKDGQTLESFISSQFSTLKTNIAALEAEQSKIAVELANSRAAERFAASVETLTKREAELRTEGTHLAEQRKKLEEGSGRLTGLEAEMKDIDARLIALGDAHSRVRFLENETARETAFREEMTKIESSLERLASERSTLVEQFEGNAELASGYDKERHLAERADLHEHEKREAETRATLDAARRREAQLAAELQRFSDVRKNMAGEHRERDRLESVAEATAFIRDTLKEAAPRVARNYVYHVSLEANLLYREITGNAERTLKWAEDYSIRLEEDGYERPFQSLSGGEQMAAALSVRLALLKQLTDIRIAFFDEPTTNMDAERRENLAQQISRISHFDQLFVISHDETFDNFVDNVVTVGNRSE